MQINRTTRIQLNIQKWLFTVLLLCVLGMLAWLSTQHSVQFDWTASKRNSLSQGSIDLLQTLPDDVLISVYAREDQSLHAAVEEILNRYKRIKHNFDYRIINPDLDIEAAQSDNVSGYGQIIIKYQGKHETISSLSEQAISSALLRLGRGASKHIIFLKGHGERNPEANDNRGYSQLAAQLKSKGFTISSHNLLQGPIPQDVQILVIAGASRQIIPGEREHIIRFIDNGGNLLWLADPGELMGLDTLAASLGIKFHSGIVVDNNVDLRKTLRIEHPAIIPVLEYYPHAVTSTITYNTLFPLARGIEPDMASNDNSWQHTLLWRSFEHSWSEVSGLSEEVVFSAEDGDTAGPVTLAVAIEKTLGDENSSSDKAAQRIIVIGDSDFMANSYVGVGANLNLAINMFNWLAGDDDLITVEIKNAPDLQLQLSDTQVLLIGTGFLIAIPLALLVTGTVIWLRRRKL